MSIPIVNHNEQAGFAPLTSATPLGGVPAMSTPATIIGIFTAPVAVFSSLGKRPRFLVATLLCIAAFMAFNITYFQHIGFETLIRAQTESNPRAASATTEQKEQAIALQLQPATKALRLLSPIVVFAFLFAVGGALYLLCVTMMGGKINYKQALSVWAYSSLPPAVLVMVINFVLLYVAPPDNDFSISQGARRGLVHANLGLLVDPVASPVLATILGSFDPFILYGLVLGAVGLRYVARLSAGAAWGTVMLLWGLGILIKAGFAVIT